MDDFFSFSKKKYGFWGILGPPDYGIGATIRIGREMLYLPYVGFFIMDFFFFFIGATIRQPSDIEWYFLMYYSELACPKLN